jgi:hypothetical protein
MDATNLEIRLASAAAAVLIGVALLFAAGAMQVKFDLAIAAHQAGNVTQFEPVVIRAQRADAQRTAQNEKAAGAESAL